jgi:hypothetical protein
VTPTALSLKVGETGTLTAAGYTGALEWLTGDASVATVTGGGATGTVTGVKAGTTDITVLDDSGADATARVTVTEASTPGTPTPPGTPGGGGGGGGETPGGGTEPGTDPSENIFQSGLYIEDDVAFEDETPYHSIVSIAVSGALNSVKLYESDSSGARGALIADMFDDGNVEHGDDEAGDGVYSARVNMMPQAKSIGKYYYRAFIDDEGSSIASFQVVQRILESEYDAAFQKTDDIIASVVPDFADELSNAQFNQYKTQIILELNNESAVKTARLGTEGRSIVVEYESGVVLYIAPKGEEGTKAGVTTIQSERETGGSDFTSQNRFANSLIRPYADGIKSLFIAAYSPFYSEFSPEDDMDHAYALLRESTDPIQGSV